MGTKSDAYPAFLRSPSPGTSVIRNVRVVRAAGLVAGIFFILYFLSNAFVSHENDLLSRRSIC